MIRICNKKIDLELDLNIYNVLATISVLKELKIDLTKIDTKFKNIELLEGRGKNIYFKIQKKISFNR